MDGRGIRLELKKVNANNFDELSNQVSSNGFLVTKVKDLINSFAGNDASVLITGESGCGKELYAQELHRLSERLNITFCCFSWLKVFHSRALKTGVSLSQ